MLIGFQIGDFYFPFPYRIIQPFIKGTRQSQWQHIFITHLEHVSPFPTADEAPAYVAFDLARKKTGTKDTGSICLTKHVNFHIRTRNVLLIRKRCTFSYSVYQVGNGK